MPSNVRAPFYLVAAFAPAMAARGKGSIGAVRALGWIAAAAMSARGVMALFVERCLRIYRPFISAYEAGLWLFWVLEDSVLAVARPALKDGAGQEWSCPDFVALKFRLAAELVYGHRGASALAASAAGSCREMGHCPTCLVTAGPRRPRN